MSSVAGQRVLALDRDYLGGERVGAGLDAANGAQDGAGHVVVDVDNDRRQGLPERTAMCSRYCR